MRYKTNLSKLLEEAEEYEWFFDIYVPDDIELTGETKVVVLDDDDEDERDEFDEPLYPRKIGFHLLMSISQLLDVISNIEENNDISDLSITIKAINYYYENDAFIS